MKMNDKKALIAMSGGVDSSVAAFLTLQEGLSCTGVTMRLYDPSMIGQTTQGTCCTQDDVEDARSVAYRLGMKFHVFNFTEQFREHVICNFVESYEAGLTPNPCVECNRHLKFDLLLQRANILGFDYLVSGHYARISRDPQTGRYLMHKAMDKNKDQSYFLYMLNQQQLAQIRFPLGEKTKEEVRNIAENQGFINAKKHDSQDICFVPDGDYVTFMQSFSNKKYTPGAFLDQNGNVVGRHQGAVCYTIGQRKGLGLAMGEPVYVCGKDMENNTVTVGPNEALFSTTLLADRWNWLPFPALTQPLRVKAKTRSRMTEQPAWVYPTEDGAAKVVFDEPQRAITPGQAVVLYDGDLVVGGGTIIEVI